MFTNVSMTGAGLAVLLITLALGGLSKFFGINITLAPDQIQGGVNDAVQLFSLIMVVVGQLRRKDLVAGIVRK